jgi:hypothetical protein
MLRHPGAPARGKITARAATYNPTSRTGLPRPVRLSSSGHVEDNHVKNLLRSLWAGALAALGRHPSALSRPMRR